MPCNASYARFIFGKFFTSTIILYILLFAQKNFYSCKKWVLQSPKTDAHASAIGLAGGAPEPTAIDVELALSPLAVASRHHRPLPSQVERIEMPTSP
jgi:Na+-transporting methylmalonyl-CoA/oxaloacetate decarboxylase beta subunit